MGLGVEAEFVGLAWSRVSDESSVTGAPVAALPAVPVDKLLEFAERAPVADISVAGGSVAAASTPKPIAIAPTSDQRMVMDPPSPPPIFLPIRSSLYGVHATLEEPLSQGACT